MRLCLQTKVQQPYNQVFEGFTQELFLSLNPPFPKVRLERFDGCLTGDKVVIKLWFVFFWQTWEAYITHHEHLEGQAWLFVDEGAKLPFFLKKWKHHHRMIAQPDGGSLIVDDVQYHTPGGWLMDCLMYPALWLQFAYRKPIYRRMFKK
ncbi:SRPBCC family protein [Eisenibacter elegans]|jgi:ligand-binding SRPBCC domain-containing protein|uniref:SRPBCC family protein n=1 Tax=Eisenibacter elegans TaxID=997 RepID=UPI000407D7F4|nr:hypothetical protein [Eisenibacter elegans]